MGRYISVPTEIEAVQFNGENFGEIRLLTGTTKKLDWDVFAFQPIGMYLIDYLNPGAAAELWVEANQQWLPIEVGEWIIRDSRGCYPCKDDIFRAKYKEI